jgi:hypothetical protein
MSVSKVMHSNRNSPSLNRKKPAPAKNITKVPKKNEKNLDKEEVSMNYIDINEKYEVLTLSLTL